MTIETETTGEQGMGIIADITGDHELEREMTELFKQRDRITARIKEIREHVLAIGSGRRVTEAAEEED